MKVKFRNPKLNKESLQHLSIINGIIDEYTKLGLRMTLRQLYYQLVTRKIFPNQVAYYRKLSVLLTEGRMSGLIDWNAIEDRLRSVERPSSWETPKDIMESVIHSYAKPRLKDQPQYLEVWVEKDALSGVLSAVTEQYHVPIMVNRGYSSCSAIYDSYKRLVQILRQGVPITILYLGDFDPSGVDMIRDVYERPLEMMLSKADDIASDNYDSDTDYDDLRDKWLHDERSWGVEFEYGDDSPVVFIPAKAWILDHFKVVPIALNKQQIAQYNLPPDPAKKTDPRAKGFMAEHGVHSWELDALPPEVLNELLTREIESRLDLTLYEKILKQEVADKKKLTALKNTLK